MQENGVIRVIWGAPSFWIERFPLVLGREMGFYQKQGVYPEIKIFQGDLEYPKAVRILKKELSDEVPIVGGGIGPLTIAAALLDMVPRLKASLKTPEKMRPFLEVAEKAGNALALVDAGANIICCEDMTAFRHNKYFTTRSILFIST